MSRAWLYDARKRKTYRDREEEAKKAGKQFTQKRWEAHWIDDHRKEHRESFRTKVAAQARCDEIVQQLTDGTYRDPNAGKVSFSEVAGTWLDEVELTNTPSTHYDYGEILRLHVLPRWGTKPVNRIRREDLIAWLTEKARTGSLRPRGGPLSPSTVHSIHTVLSQVLQRAVDNHRIPTNPARGIKLPPRRSKAKQGTQVALTMEELTAHWPRRPVRSIAE